MGELVAGTPALRLTTGVSLPLDLVSFLSLLYRAVPGSGLDPWLVAVRRSLPPELRADLDLLLGFSGRLLYYVEEPVMRFEPLRPDRLAAGFDDLAAFLDSLPAAEYRTMAAHALGRVHHDLGRDRPGPLADDEASWRRALEPALTTATADQVWPLIAEPLALKERTVRLFRGVWAHVYRDEHAARLAERREAERLARTALGRGFGLAFADLTGNRPPEPLLARLGEIERAVFCPSSRVGTFVSYIVYPPDLIIYFGAPELIAQATAAGAGPVDAHGAGEATADGLSREALLDSLRALADPTRLRILDLIGDGELYAQEIVGRLGIAQSAVSRHLAHLERAGLVRIRARRGGNVKYYTVNGDRLAAVAAALRAQARAVGPTEHTSVADLRPAGGGIGDPQRGLARTEGQRDR